MAVKRMKKRVNDPKRTRRRRTARKTPQPNPPPDPQPNLQSASMNDVESSPPATPAAAPASGPKHRIFILDDHPITCRGVAALISQEPDLCVCGQAESAPKALELIQKVSPDLAVVDISLKSS